MAGCDQPLQQVDAQAPLPDEGMGEERLTRGLEVAGDRRLGCQALVRGDVLGEDRKLLVDNVNVQIHEYNGNPIGLQLPPHVELKVTYTEPGVRGDTASGGVTKLATLETGLEIRVPLFIKEGEKVKVHTETREFAGRA